MSALNKEKVESLDRNAADLDVAPALYRHRWNAAARLTGVERRDGDVVGSVYDALRRRAILPLVFTVSAALSSGCTDDSNGGGGDGGEGGGTPTECIPSEAGDAGVGEECGVFVSSSAAEGGDGSKAKPYATIAAALSGSPKAVYLCGETFSEAVALPAGVSLYGALNCAAAWAYEPTTRTSLTGPADTVALTVSGAGTSAVEDLDVTAASATAAGGSSIAVLVDGVAVDFARCDFVAGDGAAGADGDTPMGGDLNGEPGMDGTDEDVNMMVCPMATIAGPNGGQKMCGAENVSGGNGGAGQTIATGGDGGAGGPMGTGGLLGKGENNGTPCSGGEGAPGTPGTPGLGATGLGTLSSVGYSGPPGEDGMTSGGAGKGGGGGGGANMCSGGGAGPSGGGGGSGGCGGQLGFGGLAGGSSIALVSVDGAVNLSECKLTAGNGANGGAGSPGQEGGDGGQQGAQGGAGACLGGIGGKGGRGGAAGGGLGGHSLAIAHVGDAPVAADSTLTPGDAGIGGLGGDGGVMENMGGVGADGTKADVQKFEAE